MDDIVHATGEGSGYSSLVDGEYISPHEQAVIDAVGRHKSP